FIQTATTCTDPKPIRPILHHGSHKIGRQSVAGCELSERTLAQELQSAGIGSQPDSFLRSLTQRDYRIARRSARQGECGELLILLAKEAASPRTDPKGAIARRQQGPNTFIV